MVLNRLLYITISYIVRLVDSLNIYEKGLDIKKQYSHIGNEKK